MSDSSRDWGSCEVVMWDTGPNNFSALTISAADIYREKKSNLQLDLEQLANISQAELIKRFPSPPT